MLVPRRRTHHGLAVPSRRPSVRKTELRRILRDTVCEWWNDNTFRLAAALAFYTIFSLAPVLVISVSISATVFDEAAATRQIVSQIRWLVGPEGGELAATVIRAARGAADQSPLATLVGVVMLLVGSTAVFVELQSALNTIWDVQVDPHSSKKRGMLRQLLSTRLRSLAIVLAVGFLLMVSLVISAWLAIAQEFMQGRVPGIAWLWQAANFAVSLAVMTALFAMIYKYLPDVKIAWSDVVIGAAVTAVLFVLGKYLIGVYIGQVAVGSVYGAAGSFAVLLIWTYYSALISFFGAEFTQVYARAHHKRIHPEEFAVQSGAKPQLVIERKPRRSQRSAQYRRQ